MLTKAKPQDEAALTTLIETAFAEYVRALGRDWPGPYPWLGQAIADSRVDWIGTRQGAVVRSWTDTTVQIDQICICPTQHGHGLGQRAMAAIEAEARAAGLKEITLYTAQPHTRLVAFYAAQGFRVTAVGPPPSGNDTIPRIFMAKPLI